METAAATAEQTTSSTDPEERAVEVFDRLADGEFEYVSHYFAPDLDGESPAEIPEMWNQITALFGDPDDVTAVPEPVRPECVPETDAERTVFLRVVLQGGTFGVGLAVDDEGLFVGLELAKANDEGVFGKASTAARAGTHLARRAVADGVALLRDRMPITGTGPTTPEQRVEFAVSLVELLAEGEYEAVVEQFDPEIRSAVTPGQLRAGWERFEADFDGVESVEYEGGSVFAIVAFGDERVQCTVSYDEYGRVDGFLLSPPETGRVNDYETPDYVDPTAFVEREFAVGPGGILGGSLTVPRGVGPHPAAVVVHGSGASDRDGTAGAIRPYRDVAQGLATRGIAVLRYDKRPHSDETLDPERRVVADAIDAVERLRADPAVDPDRVSVVGHSLGAYLAPRIAAESGATSAVGLAAPFGDMLDLVVDQIRVLDERDETETTVEEAERAMDRVRDGAVARDETVLGYPGAFWSTLHEYDPVTPIRAADLPALVCHAGHDWMVSDEEYEGWRALDAPTVTTRRYDDCNHVFVEVDGETDVLDAGKKAGHVVEAIPADVAGWIRER